MTKQSKTFIELSDILSFKIECPQCHCSTVIPVDGFHNVPRMCPNGCTREWEQLHTHGVTEAFNEWIAAMRLVRDERRSWDYCCRLRSEKKLSNQFLKRQDRRSDHMNAACRNSGTI